MKPTRGVVLAGGRGTRLGPLTTVVSKQLLPVYDQPLIHYPIRTLLDAGVSDIAVITTPETQHQFKRLLGNKFTYLVQPEPRGIADALLVAEEFIGKNNVALILGDNVFSDPQHLSQGLAALDMGYAMVFTREVLQASRYGVVEYDHLRVARIVEKPEKFISNDALTGIYFLPHTAVNVARQLLPSRRGELEIVDVINYYLHNGLLLAEKLAHSLWYDCGTPQDLLLASTFVQHVRNNGSTIGQLP